VAREYWPQLADVLRESATSLNITLGTEEFLTMSVPLSPSATVSRAEQNPVALVLRSRTEHLRFLRTIHTELAVTAVIAVLLATLLSFVVARSITSPLAAITHTMREVAATGDLTRKIALPGAARWQDEDARLVATTFNTLTDSIARFQREFSQKERLASLGRLSTVIAHEVRNPLMIIKAALHTLRGPQVTPTMLREATEDIDEEAARLNRIVNEVLDFARPIQFERAPTDLNQVCRESALAAEASPGPRVLLDLDPAVPVFDTDSERLRGALVNLVLNARHAVAQQTTAPVSAVVGPRRHTGAYVDASPDEGRVFLSTRANAHGVTIVIADNGVGIEAADVPRIFDPYFTTKRGGTGLGLPIAKNIVEGLGGTISVASAPGRGTEIRIDLVAAPNPEHATS
jgi:signal transduction histidine kinase